MALTAIVLFSTLPLTQACSSQDGEPGTAHPSSSANSPLTDVQLIAQRHGLHVQAQMRAIPVILPRDLEASSEWGIKQHASLRSGFDLAPFEAQKVSVTAYRLAERYRGEPLNLWVVRKSGDVVGAYLEIENATPGILGLDDLGTD